MKKPPIQPLRGEIIARKCPVCGHHELGLMATDGSFHPLEPGMLVQVLPLSPGPGVFSDVSSVGTQLHESAEDEANLIPWIPEPVKGIRELRLKYGVLIPEQAPDQSIDAAAYKAAYLHKLEMLIQEEKGVPIPVLLDRFFTAPHLATGNPKDIAFAMWEELDEVRAPVENIRNWLNHGDATILRKTGDAGIKEDQGISPPGPPAIIKELKALSLEEFLALLTATS